jgi:hypothetical protein
VKYMADVLVTETAARALSALTPSLKQAIASFLTNDFPKFAEQHEPRRFEGLEGEYWVARVPPLNGARDATPALVIMNQKKDGVQSYVLSAITPPLPAASNAPQLRNAVVGAQILSAAI